MARMNNNSTSVPILAAVLIMAALMSMTESVGATSDDHSPKDHHHSPKDHHHSPKDHHHSPKDGATSDEHSPKSHSFYDHDHSPKDHHHSPKDHHHSPKDHHHSQKDGATSDEHSPENHSLYDHDHSPKDHDHSPKDHRHSPKDHHHSPKDGATSDDHSPKNHSFYDHDHSPKDHGHSRKDHDHPPEDYDHSREDHLREDRLPRVLSWRKFKIDNIFPVSGTPDCPDANPNTVTFHPSRRDRYKGNVTIEGNFDAANIGVCTSPPGDQYAVSPNTTIHYHIYGDLVLWLITGRTTYASQFIFQQGNLSAIGLANEGTYYVSTLTDVGFGNHTH